MVSPNEKYANRSELLSDEITDSEMLDWMIKNQKIPAFQESIPITNGGWYLQYRNVYFKTPREAIVAAMKENKE